MPWSIEHIDSLIAIARDARTGGLRRKALKQLSSYVKALVEEVCQVSINTVRGINNDDVRMDAMNRLEREFRGSDDRTVCAVLSNIIRDDGIGEGLRVFAYITLIQVSGMDPSEYPSLDGFRFPESVDWQFVDRYLAEEER